MGCSPARRRARRGPCTTPSLGRRRLPRPRACGDPPLRAIVLSEAAEEPRGPRGAAATRLRGIYLSRVSLFSAPLSRSAPESMATASETHVTTVFAGSSLTFADVNSLSARTSAPFLLRTRQTSPALRPIALMQPLLAFLGCFLQRCRVALGGAVRRRAFVLAGWNRRRETTRRSGAPVGRWQLSLSMIATPTALSSASRRVRSTVQGLSRPRASALAREAGLARGELYH